MKSSPAVLCAYLLLGSVCLGQTITLPKEVPGIAGTFIEVKAETDGEIVKWFTATPGLNVFPAHLLKDSKTAVVVALVPGKYDLIAYTAKDNMPSDPSRTTIVVTRLPGPGPGPGPGPEPNPPEPEPDELTGLAKTVRDSARKVNNKDEAKLLAENYSSVISAIAAGAYDSLPFLDARTKIVSDVFTMNRKTTEKNPAWDPFFKELGALLTDMDRQGKIKSVNDIKAVFEQIQKGLEAV